MNSGRMMKKWPARALIFGACMLMGGYSGAAALWQKEELAAGPGDPYEVLKHRISPNEKWLLFVHEKFNRLYSVNLETREQHDLTAGIPEVVPGQPIGQFEIAPNSLHAAFSVAGLLFVAKLDGSERRLVTAALQQQYPSVFQPRRMFEITRNGMLVFLNEYEVGMAPVAGGQINWEPWRILGQPNLLRVSPDGKRAIVSTKLGYSAAMDQVYAIDMDTRNSWYMPALTNGFFLPDGIHEIKISPDSRKVVVVGDLYATPASGEGTVVVKKLLSGEIDLRFMVPLDYEDAEENRLDHSFTITPDSKHILYQLSGQTPGLFSRLKSIPIFGGEPRTVPNIAYKFILSYRATSGPTPRIVSKVALADGTSRYYVSHFDGAGSRTLGPPPVPEGFQFPYRVDQISESTSRLVYLTTNTLNQARITSAELGTGGVASFGPTLGFDMFLGAAPNSPWVYYTEVVNREILLRRVHAVTGLKETVAVFEHKYGPVLVNLSFLKNGAIVFPDYKSRDDPDSFVYLEAKPANGVETEIAQEYE